MIEKKIYSAGFTISPGEIGYAIGRETECCGKEIVKCGVLTFPDGTIHDKSGEHSACAERRLKRSARRNLARKRLRKIETLKVLSSYGFCPEISDEQLNGWRYGKIYPDSPELKEWLATDFENNDNPYHDRFRCATTILDLSDRHDRYCFGRAMYHLSQRRGYKSNAREESRNNMAGEVNKGIEAISKGIAKTGCSTLGEYFYLRLKKGERIRGCYTGRELHYEEEFNFICSKQNIPDELRRKLHGCIFWQRSMKSQKGNVGRCVFEKSKYRCQRSHPDFEEYRMWCFINNIRVRVRGEKEMRMLSSSEIEKFQGLFYRSKDYFHFVDIARAIAGKNATYSCASECIDSDYVFNYPLDKYVNGNPTTYQIMSLLGKECNLNNWREVLSERYRKSDGKTVDEVVNDVWHVWAFFDDPEKICAWFKDNLGIDDDKALQRAAAYVPEAEYASLSICAARKILPFLKQGYRFDEAVFFANLKSVLPAGCSDSLYDAACNGISSIMNDYLNSRPKESKETLVKDFLRDLSQDVNVDNLYHPSAVANFEPAQALAGGQVILGNVDFSFKNPVAHRAETKFRKLVNELSKQGYLRKDTPIRVMVSSEMHGINVRKGISEYQKRQEQLRIEAVKEIEDFFNESGQRCSATEDQITKWLLWKEQGMVCLYTGKTISLADFLGPEAHYDIEHTVPVSRGGDDSLMNKTLCDSYYNRDVKKAKLPCELGDESYNQILERVEAIGWISELDKCRSDYNRLKERAKKSQEGKNGLIAKAVQIKLRLDYLEGKIRRIRMTKVPSGFAFQQDATAKTVRNHIVRYLKTGYRNVFSESVEAVQNYRRLWGLPSKYQYDKMYHRKNCIDASVLVFLSNKMNAELKKYLELRDSYSWARRPSFPKPWESYTEDVLRIQEETVVDYQASDNFLKSRRHLVRDSRGKISRDDKKNPRIQSSSGVRKCLHDETFYSCRKNGSGGFDFGIRKPVAGMTEAQAMKIIDPALRQKVLDTIKEQGTEGLQNLIFNGHQVRHIRVLSRSKNLFALTRHRDMSVQEHKQYAYVSTESNYCMAFYEGGAASIISPLSALKRLKEEGAIVRPEMNGRKLRTVVTPGTLVMFREAGEDLSVMEKNELAGRLYYVKGFTTSGGYERIYFKHVAESRPDSACEMRMGGWKNSDPYRPMVLMQASQCDFIVNGQDFKINCLGDIEFV